MIVIGLSTRRAVSRRAEEELVNIRDHDNQLPLQDNQVAPLEEVAMDDQVLDVPPPMTDGEIRADFLSLAKDMTSQANVFSSQVQAMTAQLNREVRL